MTDDAKTTPTPAPASTPSVPVSFAGRSARAWTFFLALMLAWLAADLVSKWLAFEYVADVPIRLSIDDTGEPAVWVAPRTHVPEALLDTPFAYAEPHQDAIRTWVRAGPVHEGYAASAIPPHQGVTVIPGVLDLRLTLNEGAVFGSGQGLRWLFIAISVVAVAVVAWLFVRSPAKAWVFHGALAMILAGALGNLHDRFHYAAVRDMLLLFPELRLWPYIFNVADVALVVGVSVMMVYIFIADRRASQADVTRAPSSDSPPAPPRPAAEPD